MKQQVIAIVGMAGSGKSEAAAFFKQQHIPILRFGDETDRGLRQLGKVINEQNERWYREKLRADLGMAAYAIKAYERIQELPQKTETIVLDGLYSWEEYVYLSEKIPSLTIVCIFAETSTRYKRLASRPVRSLTSAEARSRDIAEIEHLNKGGPIAIADYLIVNESSIDNLYTELTHVLQKIRS